MQPLAEFLVKRLPGKDAVRPTSAGYTPGASHAGPPPGRAHLATLCAGAIQLAAWATYMVESVFLLGKSCSEYLLLTPVALPPTCDCWLGISEPVLAPTAVAIVSNVTQSAFCRGQEY